MHSKIQNIFVRSPIFPLSTLDTLNSSDNSDELRKKLFELAHDPRFIHALETTHSELLSKILVCELSEFQKYEKVVLKYLFRMSHRCTPVGGMASIAQLKLGKENVFSDQQIKYTNYQHLNSGFLRAKYNSQITRHLKKLSFMANPCSVIKKDQVWLVDYNENEGRRKYFTTHFHANRATLNLINYCQKPSSYDELIKFCKVKKNDQNFFNQGLVELIHQNIIETNFFPSRIGPQKKISNKSNINNSGIKFRRGLTLNTDMKGHLELAEIDENKINEIKQVINEVSGIRFVETIDSVSGFKQLEQFFKKSYSEKKVPFKDFIFFITNRYMSKKNESVQTYAHPWKRFLNEQENSAQSIELTENLLNKLKRQDSLNLKKSYTALISIANENTEGVKACLHYGITGWKGMRMYSRYLYMFQKNNSGFKSESKDVIFADIDYYASDLVNDFLSRPRYTDYVIRLNHHATISGVKYIDLDDLSVFHDGNSFHLFSNKYQKFVVPISSNSYNVNIDSHPFLYFISNAFHSEVSAIYQVFFTSDRNFHPRVTYKGVVLSPRRWLLERESFIQNFEDDEYRKNLNLPHKVTIVKDDQKVPIDLRSKLTTLMILSRFRNEILMIEDDWHQNFGKSLSFNGENFSHEIIFDVDNDVDVKYKVAFHPTLKKLAFPHDGIVEINVLLPIELMDSFILNEIYPLINNLKKDKNFIQFYFVKYPLPNPCIRLRIFHNHKNNEMITDELLRKFAQKEEQYLISSVSITPFEKEIETYKGYNGLAGYYAISYCLSEQFISFLKIRDTFDIQLRPKLGYDVNIIYVVLVLSNLVEISRSLGCPVNDEILLLDTPDGLDDYSEYRYQLKLLWNNFRKKLKNPQNDLAPFWKLIMANSNTIKLEFSKILKKNTNEFGGILIQNLIKRLIHMECFRLSCGEFTFAEKAIYNIYSLHIQDVKRTGKNINK